MKIYYYAAGWNLIDAIVSYPDIRKLNNMYGSYTVMLRDFEGALYGTWYSRDFTEMKIEDDSSNIIFRGYLITKTYYHDSLVLELAGLGIKLDWEKFNRTYILETGKVTAIHADAELHVYDDVNEDNVDDGASEDFGWGVNQWTLGEQDKGILIVDNSNATTEKVWVASADTPAGEDSHTGDFNDVLVKDDDNIIELIEEDKSAFTSEVDIQLDGFNIPDSVYIQQIKVRYKFDLYLWKTDGGSDYNLDYSLRLYASYDGGWKYLNKSAWIYLPWFAGTSTDEKWTSGELTITGTATELAKYFTTGGGFFDHIHLKLDASTYTNDPTPDNIAKIRLDYLEVTVYYNSADISPIMKKINSNTAEGITCTGTTWTTTGVAVNDVFYIGENTEQILNDIASDSGVSINIGSTLSKYIARNFKGLQCLDALNSVCQLEGLEWLEDYANNRITTIKKADFSDSGVDLTEADYEWDWQYQDKCNQIREFHVWGSAAYNIHAIAVDENVSGYASRQIIDDSILTMSDAQEVADTQLALMKTKRPSIRLTLNGTNPNLDLGKTVDITFVRPTIVKAAYPIRMIERGDRGIGGIKTTIYAGLGETDDIEFIGKTIRRIGCIARKTLTDRLISTPWSAGANITWTDVGGRVAGALAAINANGLALASTKVITSADEDLTFIFGRGAIGSPAADTAYFAHRDFLTTTNFALRQGATGYVTLNAPTAKNIYLMINNVTRMQLTAALLTMSVPIAMGTNNITFTTEINPIATDNVAQYSTFGRCQIGKAGSGYAYFGYRGMSDTGYMIRQTSAFAIDINTITGQVITFRNNDVSKMVMSATLLTMGIPIAMGTNKITGCGDPVNDQDVATKKWIADNYTPL